MRQPALAAETMYENDEGGPVAWPRVQETPQQRWERIRKWAAEQIRTANPDASVTP